MARRISQSITVTDTEVAILRDPFTLKGAKDPIVIRAGHLVKTSAPEFLKTLKADGQLSTEDIAAIEADTAQRIALIEVLFAEDESGKEKALAPYLEVTRVVQELTKEMNDNRGGFSGLV